MGDDDYYSASDDETSVSWVKDDRTCMIYDHNDFFTIFVQMLLAFVALAALYIKRNQEVPRRKFTVWALDVSKQGVGACYAHVMNMVIAAVLSQNIDGESELEDQCAWYGMSYLIDTTLGLILAIMGLRIQEYFANQFSIESLKYNGVYTGPEACSHWISQTVAWIFILTVVKIIIYEFMWLTVDGLAWIGGILFAPFQVNIRFELLFVMIFFPGFLNVIYFWIADGYLKASDEHADVFDDATNRDATTDGKGTALMTPEEKEAAAAQPTVSSSQNPAPNESFLYNLRTNPQFAATYLPSWTVFGQQQQAAEGDPESTVVPSVY